VGIEREAAASPLAPNLGGVAGLELQLPKGAKLTHVELGAVRIPNPGWIRGNLKGRTFLRSTDNKCGILLSEFADGADGVSKLKELAKALRTHRVRLHLH
jgi:hypothetical protein